MGAFGIPARYNAVSRQHQKLIEIAAFKKKQRKVPEIVEDNCVYLFYRGVNQVSIYKNRVLMADFNSLGDHPVKEREYIIWYWVEAFKGFKSYPVKDNAVQNQNSSRTKAWETRRANMKKKQNR